MEERKDQDGKISNGIYWEVSFLKFIILAPHKADFTGIIMGGIPLAILWNATKKTDFISWSNVV